MKTPNMSNVKWSKAQKERRKRFRAAIAYARQAMSDPQVRAHYEEVAKKRGSSLSVWRYPITSRGRIC